MKTFKLPAKSIKLPTNKSNNTEGAVIGTNLTTINSNIDDSNSIDNSIDTVNVNTKLTVNEFNNNEDIKINPVITKPKLNLPVNKGFKLPTNKDIKNNIKNKSLIDKIVSNPLYKELEETINRDNINKALEIIKANKPIELKQLETNQIEVYDAHGNSKVITLNEKQLEFKTYLEKQISCCLIGAAGTGKTTCTNAGLQALINTGLNLLVFHLLLFLYFPYQ